MVKVKYAVAEQHDAIPSPERLEKAKALFESAGLSGAVILIDALRILETSEYVVGYFGFTLDIHGVATRTLSPDETEADRFIQVMELPHPQWGHRLGTATALGDLVVLAENSKLQEMQPEQRTKLSQAFEDAALLLTNGSSVGSA